MSKMTAYCGLVCTDCPTFIATQNDDDVARAKTAAFYHKTYGFDLKPEDINCDGCLADGDKLIGYCQTCKIRKCCSEKGLANCAHCEEQPCEDLKEFHAFSRHAKASFEALRKELGLA
jgi:hypothetical protein